MSTPFEDQFFVKPVNVYHYTWNGKHIMDGNHPMKLYFSGSRRSRQVESMEVNVDYVNTMHHPDLSPVEIEVDEKFHICDGKNIQVGRMRDFYFGKSNVPKSVLANPFPDTLRTSDGFFDTEAQAKEVLVALKQHFKAVGDWQRSLRAEKTDYKKHHCGVPIEKGIKD